MGCTPSIHISQNTGIVICNQDSIEESQTSNLQPVCVVKRLSACSVKISSDLVNNQGSSVRRNSSSVTVTKTSSGYHITHIQEGNPPLSLVAPPPQLESTQVETIEEQVQFNSTETEGMEKATNCELQLGPLKVYKYPMEIQLIFGTDDGQSEAFVSAAKRGGYRYKLHNTSESATEYYLRKLPELVIIDLRTTTHFDGELLCRNMRSTRPDVNTIIIGVIKKNDTEETSIEPLLEAGFNRRFIENHNSTHCFNELLMLDYGEVSLQCKLRATSCLFSAVEHAYDAIEIQCVDPEKSEFKYVNPAYEKVTGYWRSELPDVTRNNVLSNCEVPKPDSHENIAKILSKGLSWEGVCIARKKSGEQFVQNLKVVPVIGHAGRVTHYIVVKRDLTAIEQDLNIQHMHQELKKLQSERRTEERVMPQTPSQAIPTQPPSPGQLTVPSPSSLTLNPEAPITKVINMLNAVQENSPVNVVQVLERVIDILRTTELYTPQTLDQVEGKGVEADLVEGLMWSFRERRHSAECNVKGFIHRESSTQGTSLINHQKGMQLLQVPPDIQEALQFCNNWDYDILNLERVSNNKPLYYLGQALFTHFNVPEYLSVSDTIVRNWLQLVEANYHVHNSYHNSTHAADVLQAAAVFLQLPDVKNVLDHSDEVAALIAAVVHDVDHPGFTNSFLCNAGSDLAVLYNDIAVLESHHAAMAFKLTAKDPKSNIFQNLSIDEFKLIRQSVIDMVMATEMKQHFEHLAKFDNNFNKRHSSHEENVSTNGRGTPESATSMVINYQSPENKGVLRRMIIKCSDIANPARPNKLCQEWAYRIAEEYFKQTEEEQKRDLPIVMPVFDRKTCNVPKSQLFFMDYFVMNLYTSWDNYAQVAEAMKNLRLNYEYWSQEAEQLEKNK